MKRLVIIAALTLCASQSFAQDEADGWRLVSEPNSQMAVTEYSSGNSIAVICQSGALNVVLSGLPETTKPSRSLELSYDVRSADRQPWLSSTTTTVAISGLPAFNARQLRSSRRLSVSVQSDEGRAHRYLLDLPTDPSAIDQVLEACREPLTDRRDDLARVDPEFFRSGSPWARLPQVQFPQSAASAGVTSGYAIVGCTVGPGGSPRDCRIEKESDRRAGFGASALQAIRGGRLRMTGDPPAEEGQVFNFFVPFALR